MVSDGLLKEFLDELDGLDEPLNWAKINIDIPTVKKRLFKIEDEIKQLKKELKDLHEFEDIKIQSNNKSQYQISPVVGSKAPLVEQNRGRNAKREQKNYTLSGKLNILPEQED